MTTAGAIAAGAWFTDAAGLLFRIDHVHFDGGASLMRKARVSKFPCSMRPSLRVISPYKAAVNPKIIPPFICALMVSGLIICPQSSAQTTRVAVKFGK